MTGKPVEIYVELLSEGSPCARPVPALHLKDDTYQVLATPDYDPDDEVWRFVPGTTVRCVEITDMDWGNRGILKTYLEAVEEVK